MHAEKHVRLSQVNLAHKLESEVRSEKQFRCKTREVACKMATMCQAKAKRIQTAHNARTRLEGGLGSAEGRTARVEAQNAAPSARNRLPPTCAKTLVEARTWWPRSAHTYRAQNVVMTANAKRHGPDEASECCSPRQVCMCPCKEARLALEAPQHLSFFRSVDMVGECDRRSFH